MKNLEAMKLRKLTILLLGIIVSIFTLQGCMQDEEANLDSADQAQEVELIENSVLAENYSDDEVALADMAEFQARTGYNNRTSVCFMTTWDSDNRILIIDFGNGCVGPYGKERKGKIIVSYADEEGLFMSDRTIAFDNYFVNNVQITGEIVIERAVRNEDGNLQNTYTVTDYALTFSNEETFTINGNRIREWIEGEGDNNPAAHKFEINGVLSGVSTRGVNWSQTILEPIIVDFGCSTEGNMLRTSGSKEIKYSLRNRERSRLVEYGDGNCDNEYIVTIGNRVVTIQGE
ncbi:hypothetical protein SAMN05192553_102109 [Cyclobacterium xiamenense]|uniref:Uncharacterized protein n=1 Tax=Cyclobacterium xiamenense TaxID=1297121 RepID=A0A1H6VVC2_9BACT|nr:hypothetical protein [Cyclobacterium xiamenense]SEJ04580.1 hypothetical protein SAMN05192553_102109 [Cyclobacterium xiamenense]